jgi:two-component system CheB/CheR fusion protein
VTESEKTDQGLPSAATARNAGANADSLVADIIGILDTIDVPLVVVGLDCKVSRFNRAAKEALDITASDIGRQIRNMLALSRFQNIEQFCARVMIDGISSRHDVRHGDRWFLLHIAPRTGTDRRVLGAVLTFTNVTAFRESVARAVYEREYTKAILNAVIDPLVVLDDALQVQTANRAFYDWFGITREKMQGVPLANLGDQDWKAAGLWSALKATLSGAQRFQTVELEREFPNGGRRVVLLDADRLVRDGNPLVVLAFRDITACKQTERALRQSEDRVRDLSRPV